MELAAKFREISREFAVVTVGEFLLVLAIRFVVGFGLQLFACFCVGENKSAREARGQVRGVALARQIGVHGPKPLSSALFLQGLLQPRQISRLLEAACPN